MTLTLTLNRSIFNNMYSPEEVVEIKAKIVKLLHTNSLRSICASDPTLPSRDTITDWMAEDTDFSSKCARAREEHAQLYVEEMMDIGDEIPLRQVPDPDGGFSECVDPAGVARNKLRCDNRRWYACKLLPKKYGDRIQTEFSGEIGIKRVVSDI